MQSMAEEPARLRIVSFAIHSARGVIRDQSTRRWVMFITLVIAMLMLFFGTTFLQPLLSPREHPGWFLLFWLACAWLTLTALFLALFDLLMLRAQGRAARKTLGEKLDHD
jgi:O-antigen/teichoic acid export membrane protein